MTTAIVSDQEDPRIEVTKIGINVYYPKEEPIFVSSTNIVDVIPEYDVIQNSMEMLPFPTLIFYLDDGQAVRSKFNVYSIQKIFSMLPKSFLSKLSIFKRDIPKEYDELVDEYKKLLLFRNIGGTLLFIGITFLTFLALPEYNRFGEYLSVSTRFFTGLFIGSMILFVLLIFFTLFVGRKKLAQYNTLLIRSQLYNEFLLKENGKPIQLKTSWFFEYHKSNFRIAGLLSIGLGIGLICIFIFEFVISGQTSSSFFVPSFLGLTMIGLGYGFWKASEILVVEY